MTQKNTSKKPRSGASILQSRSSGILLHPTSLPGPYGIGDIGPSAHGFVDLLASTKQSLWQMLPINPADRHNSPYSSISALASDIGLLSPDLLIAEDLLTPKQGKELARLGEKAAMSDIRLAKANLVEKAWDRALGKKAVISSFQEFVVKQRDWLEDFALFVVLADFYDDQDWSKWPEPIRLRDPAALRAAAQKHSSATNLIKFGQYLFATQWKKLRDHAQASNVSLVGDIPIFINHGSVDVWASQGDFLLDKLGRPTHVSGVPPDYFIKDGQLWGHALYDWNAMSRNHFDWWVQRFSRAYEMFDVVRIDHFIGFHRFWKIPAKAKTARTGEWVVVPGEKLFSTLLKAIGQVPIIAEDLGLVTPEVHALRQKFEFPGMRVLQFGMSGADDASYHRVHQFDEESVVYPGTHDNDTIQGWLDNTTLLAKKGDKSAKQSLAVMETLVGAPSPRGFLRLAHSSRAKTSIVQLQDVLGLDGHARMNVPGKVSGNWAWRWSPASSDQKHLEFLGDLTVLTDRASR